MNKKRLMSLNLSGTRDNPVLDLLNEPGLKCMFFPRHYLQLSSGNLKVECLLLGPEIQVQSPFGVKSFFFKIVCLFVCLYSLKDFYW